MANPQLPAASSNSLSPNGNIAPTDSLKEFQLSGDVKLKTDIKFGEKIVLECERILNSSYFSERNTRFDLNRAMAAGRMNMTKFMDFFDMNGKTNYTNISWKSIMIVNTIIARLVGRWMTKKEKATVTAIDPISTGKKNDEISKAEYYLYNKDMLQGIEKHSGVQTIPTDAFVPDDKDDLDLWAKEELRNPEEILMEKGINGVFDEMGWGDMGINARKIKHDSAIVGFLAAETFADRNGKIHVDYHRPENCFHSYSERDDLSDADIKGVVVSYKITQIKYLYPNLTIAQLLDVAKCSKQWQASDKLNYNTSTWNRNSFLPIDDWNVDLVRFTLKSLDIDKSLIKTARDGSLYVDKPKNKIEEVYPGNEYIEKSIWNIYRGVYVRQSKQILQWGLEINMIKPQAYEQISNAKSPFSFYMYNNDQMRNLAIPEKIEEPVEQMILARLKIQQLVAAMRQSGYEYDIDGLQAMDLGNGVVTPLELMRVTNQTGNVYRRSKDIEGNRLDSPIKELPNAGSVPQLNALISIYNYHLQVLRDEIGSNEFAEGQTIKPRVGAENVQTSLEVSFNATDYMNDACVALKDDIAENIASLLNNSIEFGAEEYRHLMNIEDVKGKDFCTKIEILPSTGDITQLENTINQAIAANPVLALYMNPEKIKRIARENVKLAELYFRQGQKRAIKGEAEKSQKQQEQNGKIQQDAAVAAEEAKSKSMQMEIQMKSQIEIILSSEKQKEIILAGIFGIYQKGVAMPPELQSLSKEIIQNVGLPLFAQNMANMQAINDQQQQQPPPQEGQQQEQQETSPQGQPMQ